MALSSRVGRALGDCAMSPPLQRRLPPGRGVAWQMGLACVAAVVGTVLVMAIGGGMSGPAERIAPAPRLAEAASSAMTSGKSAEALPLRETSSGDPGPAVDATGAIVAERRGASPDMAPAPAPDSAPRVQAIAPERPLDDRPRSGKTASSGPFAVPEMQPSSLRRPGFASLPPVAPAASEPPAAEPAALPRAPSPLEADDPLVRTSAATPTACLPPALQQALRDAAARFGAITLVSTTALHSHNHAGGSARAKMHLTCQAVDFRPPSGQMKQVVAFLKGRAGLGGVEGYRDDVIHIDAAPGQAMARRAPSRKIAPIMEEGDTSAE